MAPEALHRHVRLPSSNAYESNFSHAFLRTTSGHVCTLEYTFGLCIEHLEGESALFSASKSLLHTGYWSSFSKLLGH